MNDQIIALSGSISIYVVLSVADNEVIEQRHCQRKNIRRLSI